MAERAKHERIHGPYPHKRKWRCIYVGADGRRVAVPFETLEEAQAWAERERAGLGNETVGTRLTEYLTYLDQKGRRASTLVTLRYQLMAFFRLVTEDRPVSSLTAGRARELYERRCAEVKPATHRHELAMAGTFCRWCVKKGYLQANPFQDVEPVGHVTVGKRQLRLDEARAFLRLSLATPGEAALCASVALLTGARVSEVTSRVVRDLDDGGRLLWIPYAKTKAGVRTLTVPAVLRAKLLAQAAGKAPDARLFSITRFRVLTTVQALCRKAGVPVVTTHGLRGVHATIASAAGVSAEVVARELGQNGPGITRSTYIAPGTEAAVTTAQLEARLLEQNALTGGEPEASAEVPRSPEPSASDLN